MNKIIILAAGKGKRMKADLPKVLVPLKGRPMIEHLAVSIRKSGVDEKPVIIVSPDNKELISDVLENYSFEYVTQTEQLGTGHAVSCAKNIINPEINRIIVINGDHPFVSPETIVKLSQVNDNIITMLTTEVDNFDDWQKSFFQWGRIIRKNGEISEIKEFKDADEDIKKIKEVNPAIYAFNSVWLWKNIAKINNQNAQAEYYLTDLIKLAFLDGEKIGTIKISPREAMGINSKEELETAEKLMNI